jgi:ribonuclease R
VRVTALRDDFYEYYEDSYELVGQATNRRYKLGQKVNVRVENADRLMRTVDFSVADGENRK